MEMRKNMTNHRVNVRGLARYTPVAAGCLLALLALPGHAWQDITTNSTTNLTGTFDGVLPVAWENQVFSASLPSVDVNAFKLNNGRYEATVKNGSSSTPLFQVITKKSARHKTIPHLLIQYMDDRGNPIEPTWDAATQKVALSIPGKLDAGSTSYSLTVKTHLQAGAGSVTVFDKGHPYDNLHCIKDGVKANAGQYKDHQFTGLLAPQGYANEVNSSNYSIASLFGDIFSRFDNIQKQTTQVCLNGKDRFNLTKAHFGAQLADDTLLIPESFGAAIKFLNGNSTSVLFAALGLPADEGVLLSSPTQPRPGSWRAALTVKLTAI